MLVPLARRLALVSSLLALGAASARAATINVSPADTYAKIEGAKPGDEVIIAPGTYKFRVYLTQQAPANNPITIRAADPSNPPVWDLGNTLVENAPGSYTAGDRGRGCWQLSGATNVHISGLVIAGCHNAGANSAGVRYYNGSSGIVLSDIVFRDNDNGLTGGSQDSEITVQFCEFDSNGTLLASSSSPSHNVYIYGGTFKLLYSYAHDPIQGQNFHIRAQHATIEYNWFARAKSYEGDLMTDDDYDGSGTFTQQLTFVGNVIFQGTTQQNASQIIAVYNDAGADGLTLNVTLAYNTFVGPSGGHAGLVHLSNADGTTMNAELDDNLIVGAGAAVNVEDTSAGHVTGTHNWLSTGTAATGLTGTVVGVDPMFRDPANEDFTLASGSTAIGAAAETIGATLIPGQEYYRNETVARMTRARAAAHDIGAFESTTVGAGTGPYGAGGGGGSPGGSSGGSSGGDGGAPSTGGVKGSGGTGGPKTGGAGGTGSGGRLGTGGSPGTGGTHTGGTSGSHTGGANGSGGHVTAAGGKRGDGGSSVGTAGDPGVGGAGGSGGNGNGGCSCGLAGGSPAGVFTLLPVAAFIAVRRRRRRAA
jgi:MYXO-CTERM domain-containing protein